MRPSRRIPLLRGFAGASVATFVALSSHVWMSGTLPGVLGVAVPWLLSFMVCTLLSGRRLSLVRLSLSVLASQLLFHSLFVLGSITPTGGLTPHVHGVGVLPEAAPLGLLPETSGMWLAHALAAVVTIAVLHRGEVIVRVLLALAAALAAWLGRTLLTPVRQLASGRVPVAAGRSIDSIRDVAVRMLRRRGPPCALNATPLLRTV